MKSMQLSATCTPSLTCAMRIAVCIDVCELMHPACLLCLMVCVTPDCRLQRLQLAATPRAAPHARHGQWSRGPSTQCAGRSCARLSNEPPWTPWESSWAIHDGRRPSRRAPWTKSSWSSPPSSSSPQRCLSMREGLRHYAAQVALSSVYVDNLLSVEPDRLHIVKGRRLLHRGGVRQA